MSLGSSSSSHTSRDLIDPSEFATSILEVVESVQYILSVAQSKAIPDGVTETKSLL